MLFCCTSIVGTVWNTLGRNSIFLLESGANIAVLSSVITSERALKAEGAKGPMITCEFFSASLEEIAFTPCTLPLLSYTLTVREKPIFCKESKATKAPE